MELVNKSVFKISNITDKPIIRASYTTEKPHSIYKDTLIPILDKYKNMIDSINNIKVWDYCKKLGNNYELIHQCVKSKQINHGIGNYNPISRAFFKFWEIIVDFDLLDNKESIHYAALAEGPGGFIEAFNIYRRKYYSKTDDNVKCITLKDQDRDVPGWKNSNNIFQECDNYNISWGKDGTGNLYNLDNIRHFSDQFNYRKADIVSADGGFDVSKDYCNQELLASRLILAEVVTGLTVLKKHGNMVIKYFDTFYDISFDIIYLLAYYFEEVYITKPHTSRPANSEKYIVCKNYKVIDNIELEKLYSIISEYDISQKQNKYLNRILHNQLDKDFQECLYTCNLNFIKKQIQALLKALTYIKITLSNKSINIIKNRQSVYSLAWCNKYNFPINYRCRYLKETNSYNYIPTF
tara:strand:- start:19422 stop:20648 length:1227 start_codon:yes stop_codon:yes gene_type:complete